MPGVRRRPPRVSLVRTPDPIIAFTLRRTVSRGSPQDRAIAERVTGACNSAGMIESRDGKSAIASDAINACTLLSATENAMIMRS